MSKIVWLSSYPKSGNTWTRAFFSSYLEKSEGQLNLEDIVGDMMHAERGHFDEWAGIAASDLTKDEIHPLRSQFISYCAARQDGPWFQKIHDAFDLLPDGNPFIPTDSTCAVIYLVRNPLDVAVSFAYFLDHEIDETIKLMNKPSTQLGRQGTSIASQLPQCVSDWSGHLSSWTQTSKLPTCVIRYEDMVKDPVTSFGKMVKHIGIDFDHSQVVKAVNETQFDKLHAKAAASEFNLGQAKGVSFFRSGKIGSWQTVLTNTQRDAITSKHAQMMVEFGYLTTIGNLTPLSTGEI